MSARAPLLLLLLAGCSGVQTPLDPAGDQAASIHSIWVLMLWVCSFFYALVIASRRLDEAWGVKPPRLRT